MKVIRDFAGITGRPRKMELASLTRGGDLRCDGKPGLTTSFDASLDEVRLQLDWDTVRERHDLDDWTTVLRKIQDEVAALNASEPERP